MNTYMTRGPLIDGFAINCGDKNRAITLKDGIYYIECFKGTKVEAIEAISREYVGEARDTYISKLDAAENMLWLTHELYEKLKDYIVWEVRAAVAKYSDRYHKQLKDDPNEDVRVAVARYSDRYHEQLKDDKHWYVRLIVAKYKKGK